MEIYLICQPLSRTHFHTVTATSLQSIFLQQQNKWHPCYRVMTGKGWFVRINHSGNSDELWRDETDYVENCFICVSEYRFTSLPLNGRETLFANAEVELPIVS